KCSITSTATAPLGKKNLWNDLLAKDSSWRTATIHFGSAWIRCARSTSSRNFGLVATRPGRSGGSQMRVLVTGHNGYIGCALVPTLVRAGHEVVGLDSCLFEDCTLGPDVAPVETIRKDVRDAEVHDLKGFQAIIH